MPIRQQVIIIKNSNIGHHENNSHHSQDKYQYQGVTSVFNHDIPWSSVYAFWIFHINTNMYFWVAYPDINNKLKNRIKPIPTRIQAKVFTNQFLMAASQSPLVARQMVYLKCQQVCTGTCLDWSWSNTKFPYWSCESCAFAYHTQKDNPSTHSLNHAALCS